MSEKEIRALDAWIAEHVMGWHQKDVKPSKWFPDGWKNAWIHPKGGATCLPQFTTDRAAAMEVLEKCAEKTPLEKIEILKAGDEWLVQYFDDPLYEVAQEQTLPLAICLIAQRIFTHESQT